jgi:uncharacterized protein (DUF4415 family)
MPVNKSDSRRSSKRQAVRRSTVKKYAEIPPLRATWFDAADEYQGAKLVRRGRPPGTAKKSQITVRFSKDVIAYFRASGPGWQTRMDGALKKYVAAQRRSE